MLRKGLTVSLGQWLKLGAWKVGDRGLEPRSRIQVSKKQNVPSLLTCKSFNIVGRVRDREVASLA